MKEATPRAPTLWTTPFEYTKSRKTSKQRTYKTLLPPYAQRILKGVLRCSRDERVFPGLLTNHRLKDALVKAGAPKDFNYHDCRHTIATWLETQGHSLWERGLILNHADGGVTAGYSHGDPRDKKLELLSKWSDHVEQLVSPKGVTRLRG